MPSQQPAQACAARVGMAGEHDTARGVSRFAGTPLVIWRQQLSESQLQSLKDKSGECVRRHKAMKQAGKMTGSQGVRSWVGA